MSKNIDINNGWETKLTDWKIKSVNVDKLSAVLYTIGLKSNEFNNPVELYYNLERYVKINIPQSLFFEECFPVATTWYCPIIYFLNEVYVEYIQAYLPYVGIMVVGGFMTWLLPRRWKVIGVGAIAAGGLGIYNTAFG